VWRGEGNRGPVLPDRYPSDLDTGGAIVPPVSENADGAAEEKVVAVLVYDQVRLLDVTGPVEVFATAAVFGAPYRVDVCARDRNSVSTAAGTTLIPDAVIGDVLTGTQPIHTLLVPGGADWGNAPVSPQMVEEVKALACGAQRIAAVCTGAFALAAAGMLDGRQATTHWQLTASLAEDHPAISVQPDAIYVRDDPIWTSAGISAGIDLALAMVEADYGSDVARAVAREMVVFLHRPGGQSQFAAATDRPQPTKDVLRALLESIHTHPAGDHDLSALAARGHISSRHVCRLFRQYLGTTPATYVEGIRLEIARRLLEGGHSVTAAAQRSGFGSDETLRRAFLRRYGITPSAHRARFSTTR